MYLWLYEATYKDTLMRGGTLLPSNMSVSS